MAAYLLSESDRRAIQRLLNESRVRGDTADATPTGHDGTAPEVYVARTPGGGIPALAAGRGSEGSDIPGSAECEIFRVVYTTDVPELLPIDGMVHQVLNLSAEPIPNDLPILVVRDKSGSWFAVGSVATSTTADELGTGTGTMIHTGIGKVTAALSARSSTTAGTGTVAVYELGAANVLTATGQTLTVYSLLDVVVPVDTWVELLKDPGSGKWFATKEVAETSIGKTTTTITARSAATPGTGSVELHRVVGGVLVARSTPVTVTALSLSEREIPTATWVELIREPDGGQLFVLTPAGTHEAAQIPIYDKSPGTGSGTGTGTGSAVTTDVPTLDPGYDVYPINSPDEPLDLPGLNLIATGIIWIRNVGIYPVTLLHQSSLAIAISQFSWSGGTNIVLQPGDAFPILKTTSGWRQLVKFPTSNQTPKYLPIPTTTNKLDPDPTGRTYPPQIILTPILPTIINGIKKGSSGQHLKLINDGTALIKIPHQSGNSPPGGSVKTLTGTDLYIQPGDSVDFIYQNGQWVARGKQLAPTTSSPTSPVAQLPHNYNPQVVLTPSSPLTVKGMAPGYTGQRVTIKNDGSGDVTFPSDSGDVPLSDRIKTMSGTDMTIPPGDSANFFYDGTQWRTTGKRLAPASSSVSTTDNLPTGTTGQSGTVIVTPSGPGQYVTGIQIGYPGKQLAIVNGGTYPLIFTGPNILIPIGQRINLPGGAKVLAPGNVLNLVWIAGIGWVVQADSSPTNVFESTYPPLSIVDGFLNVEDIHFDQTAGFAVIDTTDLSPGTGTGTWEDTNGVLVTLDVFGPSGSLHKRGIVPDPGAVAGTTKFLREDATWVAPGGGSGTVTSVAMTLPTVLFTSPPSGSPVTTAGTFAVVLATQAAKSFLAGPVSGGAATPTFRAITADDIAGMGGTGPGYYTMVGSTADRWYLGGTMSTSPADTNCTFITDTLIAVPLLSIRGGTIDRIAIYVQSMSIGNAARLGIYEATSATNPYPGALLLDAGTVDLGSAGAKAITISQALGANKLYWLVINTNTGSGACRGMAASSNGLFPIVGVANTLALNTAGFGYKVGSTYAALPATYPASGTILTFAVNDVIPVIGVRYSA